MFHNFVAHFLCLVAFSLSLFISFSPLRKVLWKKPFGRLFSFSRTAVPSLIETNLQNWAIMTVQCKRYISIPNSKFFRFFFFLSFLVMSCSFIIISQSIFGQFPSNILALEMMHISRRCYTHWKLCAENRFFWFVLKVQNWTILYHFIVVVIDAVIIYNFIFYKKTFSQIHVHCCERQRERASGKAHSLNAWVFFCVSVREFVF